MKHEELFEVLDPPPHGLTRLRARMAARRVKRLGWAALVFAAAATVLTVFVMPREAPVDLSAAYQGSVFKAGSGPAVSALDGSAMGVERLPSSNPKVLLYRVALISSASPSAE